MASIRLPVLLALLGALGGCDDRRALHISPCASEGETRACKNTCGEGLETCTRGSWAACTVPPTRVPCQTACGEGTRLCQDDRLAAACEVAPVVQDCSTICGPGTRTCADGEWQACTAKTPTQPKLTAILRDFHKTHPDMSCDCPPDPGLVQDALGPDDKPVYAHDGSTASVSSRASFDEWYRDVPGVNLRTTLDLPLSPSSRSADVFTYANTAFFPLDGQLFGNEGEAHNYAFTAEIATRFRYRGGETFRFSGDDDVFVFINRVLAIDLGGIHEAQSRTVDLDREAPRLGLVEGGIYPMHIFFAERHMIASDFVLETTISEFAACD